MDAISLFLIVYSALFGASAPGLSGRDLQVSGQAAETVSRFVHIEGASLKQKMETARSEGAKRKKNDFYWSAYSFDVRPGVAIDANCPNFHGSLQTIAGATVSIGKEGDSRVETRNLAVFVLRTAAGGEVSRLEIYNLDRQREYSGYPVYWLGRAANAESLQFLEEMVRDNGDSRISEPAVMGIGVHDAPQVGGILKGFIERSSYPQIRKTAVFWLGLGGGESTYLSDLVSQDRESTDLRKDAIFAIGISGDANSLAVLERLYNELKDSELKKQVIFAVSQNAEHERAADLLMSIARSSADRETRKQAIFWLAQIHIGRAEQVLMNLYRTDDDEEIQKQVTFALSQLQTAESQKDLLEIARQASNRDVRKQAIFWLGQSGGEKAADRLQELYNSSSDEEVQKQILFAYSQNSSPRARQHLSEAARKGNDLEVRKQAIFWLGQGNKDGAFDELKRIYEGDQEEEIRRQILFSVSQMQDSRARDFLFEVARSERAIEVRKQAIFWISQGSVSGSAELLGKLYGSESDQDVKQHIIFSLSQTREKAGIRKLIEIARSDPSTEMRRKAMFWLGQSHNPEATKFLEDILK